MYCMKLLNNDNTYHNIRQYFIILYIFSFLLLFLRLSFLFFFSSIVFLGIFFSRIFFCWTGIVFTGVFSSGIFSRVLFPFTSGPGPPNKQQIGRPSALSGAIYTYTCTTRKNFSGDGGGTHAHAAAYLSTCGAFLAVSRPTRRPHLSPSETKVFRRRPTFPRSRAKLAGQPRPPEKPSAWPAAGRRRRRTAVIRRRHCEPKCPRARRDGPTAGHLRNPLSATIYTLRRVQKRHLAT